MRILVEPGWFLKLFLWGHAGSGVAAQTPLRHRAVCRYRSVHPLSCSSLRRASGYALRANMALTLPLPALVR